MRRLQLICWLWLFASVTMFAQKNPVPFLNQPLIPDAAAPGGPAFTLTVNGNGFVSGAVVQWNGKARATAFVSESQVKAAILASDIAKAQTAMVTVKNPGGEPSSISLFPIAEPASSFRMKGREFGTAGQNSNGLVTGDFDRDGNIDVAVIAGQAISVLLGNGDGTFRTHVDYRLPKSGDITLACADFNHDGRLDLAATNGDAVSLFLGRGDGTFAAPSSFQIGAEGATMVAGDFNGDGNLDLAVTTTASGSGNGQVSVRLGNGRGGFGPVMVTEIGGGDTPLAIAAGDFNRDGKLDLVTGAFGNTYSVLLGNGDGTFQVRTAVLTACVGGVGTADFNGDGILDLAITHGCGFMPGKVSILLGDGQGNFGPPQDYTTAGQFPGNVTVGDFNNDGMVDLLIADFTAAPGILLGNGDGTFQNVLKFPTGFGNGFAVVAAADVNNDGELDIVLGDTSFEQTEAGVLVQQR